jgi:hypothetical protein
MLDASLPEYELTLADGSRWILASGCAETAGVVTQFADALQLPPASGRRARRLVVLAGQDNAPPSSNGDLVCHLPLDARTELTGLIRISHLVVQHVTRGALLHSALAARSHNGAASQQSDGVILAAPGGTGKTTASARLRPPWRSLSDDTTLVLRGADGRFWAHPWPTWNNLRYPNRIVRWNFQQATPLRAIFFLVQAPQLGLEAVGRGQALTMLVQSAEQSSMHIFFPNTTGQAVRQARLEQFDLLSQLIQEIPVFLLHIDLVQPFWRAIEDVLDG